MMSYPFWFSENSFMEGKPKKEVNTLEPFPFSCKLPSSIDLQDQDLIFHEHPICRFDRELARASQVPNYIVQTQDCVGTNVAEMSKRDVAEI